MLKKLIIISFIACIINCSLSIKPVSAKLQIKQLDDLSFNLRDAQFKKFKIGNLDLNIQGINSFNNNVRQITIDLSRFSNNYLVLDSVKLLSKDIFIDINTLIDTQEVILSKPAELNGSVEISEHSINKLLNSEKVLKELNNLANTNIKKFGINFNQPLISFYRPKAIILENNTIQIEMLASLAYSISSPIKLTTTVGIQNSRLMLTSTQIDTMGMPLPANITTILQDKLNKLIDINKTLAPDAVVKTISIQTIPRNKIILKLNAFIKKLNFNKKKST